jgi:hypothetical protein
MIITKRALPRRTFLRGVGTTLALPLLDAMVPALTVMAQTPANPVRRVGFIYIGNGVVLKNWTPKGEGRTFEFGETLKPLTPFKDRVTVLSGLAHHQADPLGEGDGDHSRAPAVWLSGGRPLKAEGANIRGAVTLDQIVARETGKVTRVPSLETTLDFTDRVGTCNIGYSCAYMNTIAWKTPQTPLPMERNPRQVFEQLFGEGGSVEARVAQAREDRSILDAVTTEVGRLQRSLGAGDRSTVGQYLDAVRDIERRIQKTEQENGQSPLVLPERPSGIPEDLQEHAKMMFDLHVLGFQADVTRVMTMMMGIEFSLLAYPMIGVPDTHHTISHHQDEPEKLMKLTKIDTFHAMLTAYFLEKLAKTRDGDGSLLDHSMIVFGGGISNGNLHDHVDLPIVLAGGGGGTLQGGRHIRYPEDTPMANLLVSLADKVGVPIEKLGDSTGPLADLS